MIRDLLAAAEWLQSTFGPAGVLAAVLVVAQAMAIRALWTSYQSAVERLIEVQERSIAAMEKAGEAVRALARRLDEQGR